MRKTATLIAVLALLGSLTACAGGPGLAGCNSSVSSNDASSIVTATGAFGTAPSVKFPTPLLTKTTVKSQLIAGQGDPIRSGQPIVLEVTILNGSDGAVLQKTTYTAAGGSIITAGKSSFPAISEGLLCTTVGSRVAIVGSAKDSHGGKADPANGIGKDDSFIYVVDVKKAFLSQANGADQVPVNGYPAVVTTSDGTPGVTIPNTRAPKASEISVLKKGTGTKVAKNDFIVVQYTGITWSDRTVFDSTWQNHQASVVQIDSASLATGLSKALIGQRVGSQVLAVLPPKSNVVADGSGKATGDATAVYVVDILGVAGK